MIPLYAHVSSGGCIKYGQTAARPTDLDNYIPSPKLCMLGYK